MRWNAGHRSPRSRRIPHVGWGVFIVHPDGSAASIANMRINVKSYHDRKASKTNGVVAIKAIAHKLARAVFHVLQEQKPFDPKRTFV